MHGRDKFAKYKCLINGIVWIHQIMPQVVKQWLTTFYRGICGTVGLVLRYALYKAICPKCGDCVCIHPNVYLMNAMHLSIGDNVSIHPMSYLEAYGGIEIGSEVSIAHGVTIMSVSHGFKELDIPIRRQELIPMPVKLEDDVWIGAKVTLLGGITVGTGCVIGANSVVTKDIPPFSIAAGCPAKVIHSRRSAGE